MSSTKSENASGAANAVGVDGVAAPVAGVAIRRATGDRRDGHRLAGAARGAGQAHAP